METRRLLSVFHYFTDNILKSAHQDLRWNYGNFRVSMEWSSFCEKTARAAGAGNSQRIVELNNCLAHVLKEIPHGFVQGANIGFFYHSSRLLQLILLNNHQIPPTLFCEIVDTFQLDVSWEQIFQGILKLDCKNLVSVVQRIESQHSNAFLDKKESLFGILVINYIIKNSCMNEVFVATLTSTHQRLTVLLSAASLPENLLPLNSKECQTFLTTYLCQGKQECWDLLWKQPARLLFSVADTNQQFMNIYIHHLVKAVAAMEPSYEKRGYSWIQREQSSVVEFQDIVSHLNLLLKVEGMSKIFRERLAGKYHSCIWDELLAQLNETFHM